MFGLLGGMFGRAFGRTAGRTAGRSAGRVSPARRGGRGLLGGAGRAGMGFGIGSLLGGMGNAADDMQSAAQGGQQGMGSVAVGGQNNMTSAAAATSVLSDADSSDPVVRQLQDIEKVLVSIKGDTANFVSGIGSNQPQAANLSALRSGFAMPKGASEFGKAAAALGGLLAGIPLLLNQMRQFNEEDDAEMAQIRATTEAGSQERFDATIGDELTDFAMTGGAKIGGAVGGKVIAKVGEGIGEKGVKNAAEAAARSRINTSTGGATVEPDGTVKNKTGKQLHGAAADAVTESVEAARKLEAKALQESGEAVGSMTSKIGASITKNLGAGAAKAVPFLGAIVNMGFAAQKYLSGDVTGGNLELAGMTPFVGAGFDVASLVRDVYMDVYDEAPEETEGGLDGQLVADRMAEITAMATKALADMVGMGDDSANAIEAVEARPEVTGRGRNARAKEMAQKRWDDKYGATHNPDGTPKDLEGNNVEGVEPAPMMQLEGDSTVSPLPPPIQLNSSDDVGDMTDAAASNQKEQDQLVLTTALASSIGTQGQNTQTFTPEVSVNVMQPKTSFPTKNAELEFINSNGRHLV